MTRIRIATIAFVGALALTTGGCARTSQAARTSIDVAAMRAPTLVVKNLALAEVEVFVVPDGAAARKVGRVSHAEVATFEIDPALLQAGPFRVIAADIGGAELYRSDLLAVATGQTITVTLWVEPVRRLSSAEAL